MTMLNAKDWTETMQVRILKHPETGLYAAVTDQVRGLNVIGKSVTDVLTQFVECYPMLADLNSSAQVTGADDDN